LKTLTIELALARGEVEQSKANAASASQNLKITQTKIETSVSVPPGAAEALNEYAYVDKLTVETVAKAFPNVPAADIAKSLPFLKSALKEFHLSSPELVSATLAVIRTEVPGFTPMSEVAGRFNTDKDPFDHYEPERPVGKALGNKEPGDGAKFKGRGFVQITGRNNYARIDDSLGLGSRLIESPDDMNDPDVAARALCSFIATRRAQLSNALQAGDLTAALRTINGGTSGLAMFTQAYAALKSSLNPPTPVEAATTTK
jgi:predicted chitinase